MQQLPNITTHFADWYQEVIKEAQLVDQSPVRGTMIIRPYGCALWDAIRAILDQRIKETGHHNALFPLFIPESFLKREADHVEGFAPELAVVTHAGGKELEEPLVVRPTSETIIHHMFARWITSWRDLPLKINQWANVVRWEMRPRPFLRTTEFFWQEGHTAHATLEEATEETYLMMREYVRLATDYLAIPVIIGKKTEQEKFPGAQLTLTFEGIMQDGKALQMGTSHLLSQSFAHAFEMKFQDKNGELAYPFLTSWGVTTRLIGALVMVHGDQKGLVMPPRIAPIQIVIVPIIKAGADNSAVLDAVADIVAKCKAHNLRVLVDDATEKTPGAKFYHWELRGVPVRVEIGPRDLANGQAMVATRFDGAKKPCALEGIEHMLSELLIAVHHAMYERAQKYQAALTHTEHKSATFGPKIDAHNGAYATSWCGSKLCESALKEYKASIRCILDSERTFDTCFMCDEPSVYNVLIAKSY